LDISAPLTAEHEVRRNLRTHALVIAVAAAILVGAGLRFIPTSSAAPAVPGGQASTACAAT
jgi:hypothetical protein